MTTPENFHVRKYQSETEFQDAINSYSQKGWSLVSWRVNSTEHWDVIFAVFRNPEQRTLPLRMGDKH